MRLHAILGIVIVAATCFKTQIQKQCWEDFTKSKLCFPKYEKCLISGKDHSVCMNSFEICVKNGPIYNYTESCNSYTSNITEREISGLEWHQNFLDETLNLVKKERSKNDNCDFHKILFKSKPIRISNDLIRRMPSLASAYCPCMEKSDGEVIRTSKMNVPIQMWHGGFSSKKCWRELDRFLVEYLCGVSVALEINHIWAKNADCHEDSRKSNNCHQMFGLALKRSSNSSVVQSTCRLYQEMVNAYLPQAPPLSLDYKITYINATDIIYMQPFEYQGDRLYLLNSFDEDTYFTCFPVKREVSSCNYMYEHCKLNEDVETCGENLIDCLSKTTPVEPSCKTLLIQRNDNLWTLEKIFRYVRNNKLQLAYPVLLYIFWLLTKSILNWALLKIAVKICLRIKDILDRCREFIDQKTEENRRTEPGSLEPVQAIPAHQITVNGYVDIPLDEIPYEGASNNKNDNNGNGEESRNPEEEEEEEKEGKPKKKEEKDWSFGDSFKAMLTSFCRLFRSIYQFLNVTVRKCL